MVAMNDDELLREIEAYSITQADLLGCFLDMHPEMERKYLTGVPKKGELLMRGEPWRYRIHGQGVEFENDSGWIVDAHAHVIDYPHAVDAHRISGYLTSKFQELNLLEDMFDYCRDRMRELSGTGSLKEVPVATDVWVLPSFSN